MADLHLSPLVLPRRVYLTAVPIAQHNCSNQPMHLFQNLGCWFLQCQLGSMIPKMRPPKQSVEFLGQKPCVALARKYHASLDVFGNSANGSPQWSQCESKANSPWYHLRVSRRKKVSARSITFTHQIDQFRLETSTTRDVISGWVERKRVYARSITFTH